MSGKGDQTGGGEVLPERTSAGFRRMFSRYVERMMRRRFHAVRLLAGDERVLDEVDASRRPTIILISHASWWDPLLGLLLWRRCFPNRDIFLPMDESQLRRFAFFRRIGVFGIDPDNPKSLDAMRRHVLDRFSESDTALLGLTPQGRFTDPREPVRLRPGAAAIAASLPEPPEVAVISVEYVFWQDARPEVLVSTVRVTPPEGTSTASWQRRFTDAMSAARDRLATAAIGRRPEDFNVIVGAGAKINPFMDAWLRWRGQSGGIEARRNSEAAG